MKLSELVEGWPEKKEVEFMDLIPDIRFKDGHNACREACDKEVMVDESMIRIIIYSNTYVEKCILKIGSADDVEKLAHAIAQNIKGIIKEVK